MRSHNDEWEFILPINKPMSNEIIISSDSQVYCNLRCDDPGILREIAEYFTFMVPNARFVPSYRNKVWDGKIRLFNAYTGKFYVGLMTHLFKFCKERAYNLRFDGFSLRPKTQFTESEISRYLTDLRLASRGTLLTVQTHQKEAILAALNRSRILLLSPTGSGKSLIIYSILRKLIETQNSKILLIVPTIGLVNQMFSDFEDYSSVNGWSVEDHAQKLFYGHEKVLNKNIMIATWQSAIKLSKDFFAQFDCVIVDECHLAKNSSLTTILQGCSNAKYRIGLTGTLDGTRTHRLVVEALTGPVLKVATTKELIDKNILSKLNININLLFYGKEAREQCKGIKYPEEIQYLISNKTRNEYIINLAKSLTGNTLILYQYVDKHGAELYSIAQSTLDPNRPLFYVHGGIDFDYRENVRTQTEKSSDAIIIASLGTFSTGISIKKLHNIIFATPSKGRIRVLQSIGRQLRKSDDKDVAQLYDIIDDLSHKSSKNYSLKHGLERIKIYTEEQFDYKITKYNI